MYLCPVSKGQKPRISMNQEVESGCIQRHSFTDHITVSYKYISKSSISELVFHKGVTNNGLCLVGLAENLMSMMRMFDGDEEPESVARREGVTDEVCGD
ncbi:hypothetical protein ACFX2A_044635 [Malus domestica]